MGASIEILPHPEPPTQPPPLAAGDVVRAKDRPRPRETGVVRRVAANRADPGVLVYWYASGHRVWHRRSALVPTGERVAPRGGAA